MRSLLCGFALTVLLNAGAAFAQMEESSPALVAQDDPAGSTDRARARRARKVRRKRLAAPAPPPLPAVRHLAAVGHEVVAPPTTPTLVPQPEAAAKPALPPVERPETHAAAIDTQPAEAPVDATPAMAPVKEQGELENQGTAKIPSGDPSAAHGQAEHISKEHGGTAEHGSGHGEHAGFSGKTFALQLINFGVLLFLLIWFGGRAMNKALRARHEQLKGDIGEAARLRDEATRKFQAQEQRVTDLEKEIAALRASIRQDAEREQARLLEGAQERAKRIQEDMRIQLDQQVKEAESLLRAEVASASVRLAEELVRKSVNTEDERRLAREFVAGFDRPAGPEGPGQGDIR
jgi:F-type H+-transporting ATPase subunit b